MEPSNSLQWFGGWANAPLTQYFSVSANGYQYSHISAKIVEVVLVIVLTVCWVRFAAGFGRYREGNTQLHHAIINDDLEQVKAAIRKVPNINKCNRHGQAPLHFATVRNNVEAVRVLLANNANPNITSHYKHRMTPLHYACTRGYTDIVKALVASENIDLHCENSRGETPLHLACSAGKLGAMQALVETDAVDVNAQSEGRDTPLHRLFFVKQETPLRQQNQEFLDMLELLVSNGADPTIQNDMGESALDLAVKFRCHESVHDVLSNLPCESSYVLK